MPINTYACVYVCTTCTYPRINVLAPGRASAAAGLAPLLLLLRRLGRGAAGTVNVGTTGRVLHVGSIGGGGKLC